MTQLKNSVSAAKLHDARIISTIKKCVSISIIRSGIDLQLDECMCSLLSLTVGLYITCRLLLTVKLHCGELVREIGAFPT